MENKRDSFIFYRSFYEAIKDLPAEEKADILDAICELSLNFEEIELSGISKSLFILIKPQLEANIKRYENGKKPKTKPQKSKTEAKPKQTESKSGTNVNVNDNVNPNDNKKENKEEYKYTLEREVLNEVRNLFDIKYRDTEPKRKKWLDEVRKLIQIDNEQPKDIIEVIKFARSDDFWKTNLLSIGGIRKKNGSGVPKYDQIKAKMNTSVENKDPYANWGKKNKNEVVTEFKTTWD